MSVINNVIIYDGIKYCQPAGTQTLCVIGFDNAFDTRNILKIPEAVNGILVDSVEEAAFYKSKIKSLILPESLRVIKKDSFAECENLVEVLLMPVKYFQQKECLLIDTRAFDGCCSLHSVVCHTKRIANIKRDAFHNCTNLYELGVKLQQLDGFALNQCQNLHTIHCHTIGMLKPFCLEGTDVKVIDIPQTCIIDAQVLERIRDYNILLRCGANSAIADLAYNGYNVEVI